MPKKKIRKFVAEEEREIQSDVKNPNQVGKDEKNKLGAKIVVATSPLETASPSNPEEKGSEVAKEFVTKEKKEKTNAVLMSSEKDEEKPKEI